MDLALEPGQLSLHHTHLVHASAPNASADRRIGIGISYIPTRVRFTRDLEANVDSIWVCGCQSGCTERIAELRREHPAAVIVATGHGVNGAWRGEALEAGADRTANWPIAYEALERFLSRVPHSVAG